MTIMLRNVCPRVTGIILAIALTTGCTASDESDQSSADPGALPKSLNSDTPALITFDNRSGEAVNIYWIDFGGKRQKYNTLEPGGSYTQQTYLTHPWLVTDARGKPWNVYLPEARPRTVDLHAPSDAVIAR